MLPFYLSPGPRLHAYADPMSAERDELRQLIQDLPEEEVPAVLGALWPRLRAGKNRADRLPGSVPPRAIPLTQQPEPRNGSKAASVNLIISETACRSHHQAVRPTTAKVRVPPGSGMARPRPGDGLVGAAGHSTNARC